MKKTKLIGTQISIKILKRAKKQGNGPLVSYVHKYNKKKKKGHEEHKYFFLTSNFNGLNIF